MTMIGRCVDQSFDHYSRIRLGRVTSDINENGKYSVVWLDVNEGGQDSVQITHPMINNSDEKTWGLECGVGNGTIGVFGFVDNNSAVLLTTLTSGAIAPGIGYNKTEKIKTGEFRITSKGGAKIYLGSDGGITISSEKPITVKSGSAIVKIDGESGIDIQATTDKPLTVGTGTYPIVYSLNTVTDVIANLSQLKSTKKMKIG